MNEGTGECSTWRSNLECSGCLNYLEGLHKQRMTHVLCSSGRKNRGKWIYITEKCWFTLKINFLPLTNETKERECFGSVTTSPLLEVSK